jgi:hypothetical protein
MMILSRTGFRGAVEVEPGNIYWQACAYSRPVSPPLRPATCPCIVRCGWRSLRRLSRGIWRRVASFHSTIPDRALPGDLVERKRSEKRRVTRVFLNRDVSSRCVPPSIVWPSLTPSIACLEGRLLVLRHCLCRSGRGRARVDARTGRCRSSVRRSSGSGSHSGPPGRSRADGHCC